MSFFGNLSSLWELLGFFRWVKGGSCDVPGYDGDLLELLSPTPLESNSSMTIAKVLSLAPKQAWSLEFGGFCPVFLFIPMFLMFFRNVGRRIQKRCPSDVWLLELPLRCRTGNVLLVSCRWPPF